MTTITEYLTFKAREDRCEPWRKCDHCGGEVLEVFAGDEGLSVCQECEAVEGGDTEVSVWP